MTDRDKVIKGLECCGADNRMCQKCPYDPDNDEAVWEGNCEKNLINDALKLLKAQDQLCNVDIPEGVTEKQFYAVMSNVIDALYPDFAKDIDVLT